MAGIPPMVPYEFTALSSVLQPLQADKVLDFAAIYYQDPEGNIQQLIEQLDDNKLAFLPPAPVLKLGTPLAAINIPAPEKVFGTRLYAVTKESAIIETFQNEVVVMETLEDTRLAAITDNTHTRVFYQPKGKDNEIVQAIPGLLEQKLIVSNAIKGTNMGALETSLNRVSLLNFDRCLVYHGQDTKLHFWSTQDELPPQTEVIPVDSILSNSAVAVARTSSKIFVYYQDEQAELYYIVKRDNFGFNWGTPHKVEAADGTPVPPARRETALTAITSGPPGREQILLSYQGPDHKIHAIPVKISAD